MHFKPGCNFTTHWVGGQGDVRQRVSGPDLPDVRIFARGVTKRLEMTPYLLGTSCRETFDGFGPADGELRKATYTANPRLEV